MNKTLAVLYSEHEIIKSVIEFRERISSLSKSDPQKYKNIINELVNFFRNYADKFHHYKEEKLLFPLMCEKNEMLQESIVSEMLENHQDFRKLVNSIETEVNSDNFGESVSLLSKYTEMLLDHIAVEDDELFQIAETLFDDNELEKLYFDFQDIDRELGFDNKIELEKMKENLESILDSN
ncbi:MAG: hemerythrin domain-containing protein [Ignavibacteria bacterium]|nr:hemerythrin domain-containing protein [Ignavibacteria bacterium]